MLFESQSRVVASYILILLRDTKIPDGPASPQDPGTRRKIWVIIALALLAVALLLRYSTRSVVQVRMGTARRGELLHTLATNGIVEPIQNFAAYSPMAGTVKDVYVHEGEKVKAGQPLIALDDSAARSQVAAALAAVRGAQAALQALQHGGTRNQQITLSGDIGKAKAQRDHDAATLATLEKLQQQGAASASEVDERARAVAADDAALAVLGQQQTQSFAPIDLQHATANLANAQAAYASAPWTHCEGKMCAPRSPELCTPSPCERVILCPPALSCFSSRI